MIIGCMMPAASKIKTLLFFLCLFSLCGWIDGQDVYIASFRSREDLQAARIDPANWEVVGDEVCSKAARGRMVRMDFDRRGWSDFDLSFSWRRSAAHPGDQHVGVFLRRSANGGLRFYTRGDEVILLEEMDGRAIRHQVIGRWPAPLFTSGSSGKASRLRVRIQGRGMRIWSNGVEVAAVDDIAVRGEGFSIYSYNADLAVSDIQAVAMEGGAGGSSAAAIRSGGNILRNSDFEQVTLDRLPDYWGCQHWGIVDPYWVTRFDSWVSCFGVVEDGAFHGSRCMRIVNPRDQEDRSGLCLRSVKLGSKVGDSYIFSAWMRCDPAGMGINLAGSIVRPDGTWKRYSTRFVNNGKKHSDDMVSIHPMERGTVWIDAVQLELGDATDYAPMVSDGDLLTEEGNQEKSIGSVPEMRPPLLLEVVKLDGRLDDPVWQKAQKIELGAVSGGGVSAATDVYVWYDERGIYIGCRCVGGYEREGRRIDTRDKSLWNRESIELFIDPGLSRGSYRHLVFDAWGSQFDAATGDVSWNGTWMVATSGDPATGWQAEVFLPFSDLGIEVGVGARWGLNVCRNNLRLHELSCWSPTYGGFHAPARFGHCLFVESVLDSFRVDCSSVRLRRDKSGFSGIEVDVRNRSSAKMDLKMEAFLTDDGGGELSRFECDAFRLAQGEDRCVSINSAGIKIPPSGFLRCILRSSDGVTRYDGRHRVVAPPLLACRIRYRTIACGDSIEGDWESDLGSIYGDGSMRLRVVDGAGRVHCDRLAGLAEMRKDWSISTMGWGEGCYDFRMEIVDAGGKVIAESSIPVRLVSQKSGFVQIDRISRMLSIHGSPFLPTGFYWEGHLTEEVMKYLSLNGCNMVVVKSDDVKSRPGGMQGFLDAADRSGLRVSVCLPGKDLSENEKTVLSYRDHPAILTWNVFDEIFTGDWGKANYAQVKAECDRIAAFDPWHPVHINENQYGLSWLRGRGLSFPGDIVSIDYYPWTPNGNVIATGDYVRQMMSAGESSGLPGWIYLLGSGYAYWASRDLTPLEQEFSTYISLINGARSVIYFASHPKSASGWNRIRGLMSEMRSLAPILATGRVVTGVRSRHASIAFSSHRYDGCIAVLAVNSSREAISQEFDFSSLGITGGDVEVLFEGRSLRLDAGGRLSDCFSGYQRHVYLVRGGR